MAELNAGEQIQEIRELGIVKIVMGHCSNPQDITNYAKAFVPRISGYLREQGCCSVAAGSEGWVPPETSEIIKALGSGWEGFALNEPSDLEFIVRKVRVAMLQLSLAPPASQQAKEGTKK